MNKDKTIGALVGLATGDALGTTLEFKPYNSFEPIKDIVGGGPFGLNPGAWTDDTSMALCLAESLIEKERFDIFDQSEKYLDWFRNGRNSVKGYCFDIGNNTRSALVSYERTGNPYYNDSDAAGNGALMRLAPIPMFYRKNLFKAFKKSEESSRNTHPSPQSMGACALYGAMIALAINGKDKEDIMNFDSWDVDLHAEISMMNYDDRVFKVISGSYKEKQPPQINGNGYVIDTLEAALWAFWSTESFEEGALKVVNLGDDADTTGAVYGQLAGAYYGLSGIPEKWRNKIYDIQRIIDYSEKIYYIGDKLK